MTGCAGICECLQDNPVPSCCFTTYSIQGDAEVSQIAAGHRPSFNPFFVQCLQFGRLSVERSSGFLLVIPAAQMLLQP